MNLRFEIVDVFTDRPFAGNQLAVVYGGEVLPGAAMQALAAEFGFAETVFPLPPTTPGADYRLRIFTPSAELPFAGHPSVGAAWALARAGVVRRGELVQECGAGLLPVLVDDTGARLGGATPTLGPVLDAGRLAAAVGLAPSDVDFSVTAGVAGAGISFGFLPLAPGAVSAAVPDAAALRRIAELGTGLVVLAFDGRVAHARMFGPAVGVAEDPATGSAALALGGWLVSRGLLPSAGTSSYRVHQGAEIGRPSTLDCTVTAVDGAATSTTVRGAVAAVATGEIVVPADI